MRRAMPALLAVAVLLAVAWATPSAAVAASSDTVVPVLNWQPCHDGFQCATARVPLDYRQPHGATIDLALIRHPATDPARRAGALFVNGGGPSPQIDAVVAQYQYIPEEWRARFDIVGFDPRGFGHSTAVQCFPSQADGQAFLAALPPFPVGDAQIASWDRTWARFDDLCAQRNGDLLRHDSTADTARDMDLLRRAVGAPMLNYVGLSYGTGLGAIYANLFPATVGRMILDGNVDPVAWTSGRGDLPMFMRDREDEATAATMRALLDLCGAASTSACAFSAGTPAATRAKFDTLLDRLLRAPVTVTLGGQSVECGYACAISGVPLGSVNEWPGGAQMLQQLWDASTGTRTAPAASATAGPQVAVYSGPEQGFAAVCSDGPNPRDPAAYRDAARLALARSGPAGLVRAWATEPCAGWPAGADGYSGPWNRPTAGTILLVGNTGDPATPYWDSQAMARDLARARLLTLDGYGHTEFFNPSTCVAGYELDYLTAGTLPPAGTVCRPDAVPFG